MKPYERRACGQTTYFKVAVWDARNTCWRDGKRAYDTEAAAIADAPKGQFRLSRIDDGRRTDLQPLVK